VSIDNLAKLKEAAGAWVWDVETDRLFADARFATLCNLDVDEARAGLPTSAFVSAIVPADRMRVRIALAGVLHGSETFNKDYRVRLGDGTIRWVSARGKATRDPAGRLSQFTGLLVDITEQKRVEEQLRVAQTAGGVGTFQYTDGFGTADVSEQFCRLLGLQASDALPVRTINAVVEPGDPAIVQTEEAGAEGRDGYAELRIRRADTGELRWIARRGEHRLEEGGSGGRFTGVIYDITSAKSNEQELRVLARTLEQQVEERTRERDRIWNRARDLFFVMSSEWRYRAINPAWKDLLGYEEADLIGQANAGLLHPDDGARIAELAKRVAAGEALQDVDARLKTKDGQYRWINWTVVPEDGLIYGLGRDVTERKELEDQLHQSQKMEAVGQLTGGLAHDFNNMLTGIIGSIDLARRRMAQGRGAEADQFLQAATDASERAAALTHRLLAFSRRQTLDPQHVDANVLISSVEELMRRTLGERVRLVMDLQSDLWATRCDPNQLESAILNLAINARDAMQATGKLIIGTRNQPVPVARKIGPDEAAPGDYVAISVSDSGTGIPPAIVAKVFEPFFTTKPMGQGTGLGLSMVYGFVRQSGGHVDIDSRLGEGTTITLYLPRAEAETIVEAAPVKAAAAPSGAGESVLLVEDDPQVRMLVRVVLDDLGYRILEAEDGPSALAILQSGAPIHLLITDVGLPGMNGRQLADFARMTSPSLPILFMTGYIADEAERAARLEAGMAMISKPFTVESLARCLHQVFQDAGR
jgi:PAS domain S-box-containing protein